MKTFDEIMASGRIIVIQKGMDGFDGRIIFHMWEGTIRCSKGAGWEHVSVTPRKKNYTPSWDDMCRVKDVFWNDEEAVIQIHPPKSEYVNNVENCLHLWRCYYKDMVLPPSVLVGWKEGQTKEELKAEERKAYEMAGEKYW